MFLSLTFAVTFHLLQKVWNKFKNWGARRKKKLKSNVSVCRHRKITFYLSPGEWKRSRLMFRVRRQRISSLCPSVNPSRPFSFLAGCRNPPKCLAQFSIATCFPSGQIRAREWKKKNEKRRLPQRFSSIFDSFGLVLILERGSLWKRSGCRGPRLPSCPILKLSGLLWAGDQFCEATSKSLFYDFCLEKHRFSETRIRAIFNSTFMFARLTKFSTFYKLKDVNVNIWRHTTKFQFFSDCQRIKTTEISRKKKKKFTTDRNGTKIFLSCREKMSKMKRHWKWKC